MSSGPIFAFVKCDDASDDPFALILQALKAQQDRIDRLEARAIVSDVTVEDDGSVRVVWGDGRSGVVGSVQRAPLVVSRTVTHHRDPVTHQITSSTIVESQS